MAFTPSLEKHPGSLLPLDTALWRQNDSRGDPSVGRAGRETADRLEESPVAARAAFPFANEESGQIELVVGDRSERAYNGPSNCTTPLLAPLCASQALTMLLG